MKERARAEAAEEVGGPTLGIPRRARPKGRRKFEAVTLRKPGVGEKWRRYIRGANRVDRGGIRRGRREDGEEEEGGWQRQFAAARATA